MEKQATTAIARDNQQSGEVEGSVLLTWVLGRALKVTLRVRC